ncbi:MAG: 2-oxoglutarate ferredoxin oxidoreductase subunit alpha [Candidatus Marinamargulisbacteria bacterium]|jgi:2-oxoglutarate ferredoxin oxidoreductase subunit alpha
MTTLERSTVRFELLMDAGNGAQKAGDILIKSLARSGRFVFIEPMIPAEISPPKRTPHSMSGVIIRSSNEDLTNIGSDTDFMIVEHEILLKRRMSDHEFNPDCVVLLDMSDEKKSPEGYAESIKIAKENNLKVLPFQIHDDAKVLISEMGGQGKNMFYLGLMTALFQLDKGEMIENIRQTFKKLSEEKLTKNVGVFELGVLSRSEFSWEGPHIPSSRPNEKDNILMDGNTALAVGIIDSGIKLFSGYPITPASSIMHYLAKHFQSFGGLVHQAEDEISAIGTVIGSYYGGVPAITATSGPGLSLKQEFIGLATSAEIPLIVVNVQRGGPSTGLPTKTEQSDLQSAAFGGHGDNTKVILSVSNVEDCFYAPHVARYLTEKLRVPVLILSDYLTSVSYTVLKKFELQSLGDDIDQISDDVLARFGLDRLPSDIEMVKENQSIPGDADKMRRITGLNTDREGKVVYDRVNVKRASEIRNEKIHHVRRSLKMPEIFGEAEGDLLIVSWGSGRGVLEESVKMAQSAGLSVSGMNLKIVAPLPLGLKSLFSKFKKVAVIELAYGDELKPSPLAMLLRSETLVDVQSLLTEATGRPMKPKSVFAKIKESV